MTFASDKLYKEFLRVRMGDIATTVKALDLMVHLPCLTQTDREAICAKKDSSGNFEAMLLLLDNLKRRDNWAEQFISALEKCEHWRLASEVREKYNSLTIDRNGSAATVPTSENNSQTRPVPSLSPAVPKAVSLPPLAPPPASLASQHETSGGPGFTTKHLGGSPDAVVPHSSPTEDPVLPSVCQTPPPASHTPPSASHTPPSASQTPPPASHTPPSASHTPPSASQTPPPASHTPPSASHIPPSASHTPPSASQTPPPASHTPPSASHTPPSASQTPPPASHTPPSASHTPPSASQNPPPSSHTPPPASHTPPPVSQTPSPANQTHPIANQTPRTTNQTPLNVRQTPPTASQTPPTANRTSPPVRHPVQDTQPPKDDLVQQPVEHSDPTVDQVSLNYQPPDLRSPVQQKAHVTPPINIPDSTPSSSSSSRALGEEFPSKPGVLCDHGDQQYAGPSPSLQPIAQPYSGDTERLQFSDSQDPLETVQVSEFHLHEDPSVPNYSGRPDVNHSPQEKVSGAEPGVGRSQTPYDGVIDRWLGNYCTAAAAVLGVSALLMLLWRFHK